MHTEILNINIPINKKERQIYSCKTHVAFKARTLTIDNDVMHRWFICSINHVFQQAFGVDFELNHKQFLGLHDF